MSGRQSIKREAAPTRGRPEGQGRKAAAARTRMKAKLSQADIVELAAQMHMPEGTLRLVLSRYPELARPLARRRALVA